MADAPKSSSDTPDIKQTTEMSREALAKKLGVSIDTLPQYEGVLKISKQQLDALKEITGKVSISEQLDALKEKISQIKAEDIKNKTDEVGKNIGKGVQNGIDTAKKLTPEAMNTAISETTKTLKKDIGKGGTEVLGAVGDIVNAESIEGATGGITKLSKAIDAISTTFSTAMKGIGDMLSAFMSMLGLDKLWGSIKGLFGGSNEEKKEGDSAKKKVEEGVDVAKKEGADLLKKGEELLKTPVDKEKIVSDMSTSLGKLIGEKYFGKGVDLSPSQLEKIKTIIGKNLDISTLEKIRAQYMKDGTTRMGDVVDVNIDLMAKLPAGAFFDIALSGIIPTHKIIYNTIVEPSKNLIQLTFDGLPFVDMQMNLADWSGLLSKKVQEGDSHALDLARVQLYAVNGLLWKTMGLVTSGIAAGGIALLSDTVTGVNGFRMGWNGLSWDFDALSRDISTIESTLGTGPKGGSLGVLSDRLKGLQHNYLMLDLALKGNEDPTKMMSLLKDDSKYLSLKQNMKIADLELSVGNKEIFQRKMAGYLMSPDVTRDISSATKIAWSKGIGGAEGSIRHYMETTDDLLAKQKNMFLAGNIRNVLGTPLLALKNMKMARSADSVLLHIDDVKDVLKLRAFLAVIPGGLKGLAEFIPATSIVFSIGSIAMDNKNEKGGVYESMMDVAKTVFVPAYGSVSMLMDKTVDIKSIISEGKMPPFGDMALTGVIGGVAVFETVRVANQVAIGSSMMYHGAAGQGAKTIAMAPFRGITDIVNAAGSAVRGTRNIAALARAPIANPAATKALTSLAAKIPKKNRYAIGAIALLTVAGGAYAYASGPEKPEDIMKNLHKDGWLDISNNPTSKMKEAFQGKNGTEKKNIIDELLIMHLDTTKNLPKTHYDEKLGKYTLVTEGDFTGTHLIDSPFRNTLQSLGVDIDLEKA